MAVNWQAFGIDLARGLDRKHDSKVLAMGPLTTLDNGRFSQDTITRRDGQTALTAFGFNAAALFAYKNRLLAVADNRNEFGEYGQGVGGIWLERGPLSVASVTSKQVVRNTATQKGACCASVGAITVWVWEDSRGGVRATVIDETSGAATIFDTEISATGVLPRCVVYNSKVCVFYIETGNLLRLRTISSAAPTAFASAVTVSSDARSGAANAFMDATVGVSEGRIYVTFVRASTTQIGTLQTDDTGAIVTATVDLAVTPTGNLHINTFLDGRIAVFWSLGTGLDVTTYTSTITGPVSVSVDATATQVVKITSGRHGENLFAVYEFTAAATYNRFVSYATVTSVPTVLVPAAVLVRSVGLASQAFLFANELHVAVVHESAFQSTLFVVGVSGTVSKLVVAKALVWRSAGLVDSRRLPNITPDFGVNFPAGEKGRLATVNGKDITTEGISRITLDTLADSWRSAVEFNDSLYIAGACPTIYDGFGVVEADFHIFPENYTLAQTDGGAMPDGVYQYAVLYEWTDAQGKLHRSVAGVPVSITVAGGAGLARVVATIPTLRLTQKRSPRSVVNIVVYRTEASGTVFYRLNSSASPLANDTAVDTVTYTDNTLDAALRSNELLYTTGGALDNEPCPPCRGFIVHQNRLFAIGLENGQEFAYSKQVSDGEYLGVGFNESLRGTISSAYGRLSGGASLDDKLVLFTERRPFYISGEGPNNAGQQNGYSTPQEIAADVGCRYGGLRSCVREPNGVWFQTSGQELRLLTRNLEIGREGDGKFIGAAVDNYATAAKVVSAFIHDGAVWFFNGTAVLVWNYTWGQWSRFTNFTAIDAVRWGGLGTDGLPAWITAAGATRYYTGADDAGTAIQMTVETGWIKFAGVQGFQRVRKLSILGTFIANSQLAIEEGYDYAEAYTAAVALATGTIASATVPILVQHGLARQKCAAVRFRISENNPAIAGGFKLSNLTLEVGIKSGSNRLPAVNRV